MASVTPMGWTADDASTVSGPRQGRASQRTRSLWLSAPSSFFEFVESAFADQKGQHDATVIGLTGLENELASIALVRAESRRHRSRLFEERIMRRVTPSRYRLADDSTQMEAMAELLLEKATLDLAAIRHLNEVSHELPSLPSFLRASRMRDDYDVGNPRKYVVFMLTNVAWDGRRQRPQHLATMFGEDGHPVFYCSFPRGVAGTRRNVSDGVVEIDFEPSEDFNRYQELPSERVMDGWMGLIDECVARYAVDEAVLHIHLHSWLPFATRLRAKFGWRIVYDCMDDWDVFPGFGPELIAAERELVRTADLVSVTAVALRNKWLAANQRTILVRNAVDIDRVRRGLVPSSVIETDGRPIIGFIGAIAEWVDIDLVRAVASRRPGWRFVFVGDIFVPLESPDSGAMPSNVEFVGLKPSETVSRFLFWFDVAVIPFKTGQLSAAVDPVKVYEYAAAGLPVVATSMPELDRMSHLLYLANDAESFERSIDDALTYNGERARNLMAFAERNTWKQRLHELDPYVRSLWPRLSVIVVTYGELVLTQACLRSVLEETAHPNFEVIVVDNASGDGTPRYLRWLAEHDERVRIILNDSNLGFAAANNQGLQLACGDHLILLNNDTEVTGGWSIPLINHLRDASIGLVGPRSDSVGNRAKIEVPHDVSYDDFCRQLRASHAGEGSDIQMLAMFCVAMRRDVYEAVGPLDEGYGLGLFEDDDYAMRIRAAGLRVVLAEDCFVHHVGQGSFGRLLDTDEYQRIWTTNQARFEARWGTWQQN